MNEMVIRRSSAEVSPLDATTTRAIAAMANKLERQGAGWVITADQAPTDRQRQFLERRVSQINAYVATARPGDVVAEIGALFAVMKAATSNADDEEIRQRIYISDLSGVPLRGLQRACAAYRRGELGDGKWMPTPGELRATALGYVEAFVAERGQLLQILQAKTVNPVNVAKKASIREIAEETIRVLAMNRDPFPKREDYREPVRGAKKTIEDAEAALAQMQANIPKITLSAVTLETFGIMGKKREDVA